MPSKYTLETLPKPLDRRVRVRQIDKTRFAVVRFSGAPSERAVAQKMEELVAAVEEAGLDTSGRAPTYARYDPPWTLPPLRRNEIFVELSTSTASGE
jgi:DNA gyrase inhibitor GyrI